MPLHLNHYLLSLNLLTFAANIVNGFETLFGYQKKGESLTRVREKAAIDIVRKHRLREVLLVEKLEFSRARYYEIAEQLEYVTLSWQVVWVNF